MFVQLTFEQFKKIFPLLYSAFRDKVGKDAMAHFLADEQYLVRVSLDDSFVEVGYKNDEWHIC